MIIEDIKVGDFVLYKDADYIRKKIEQASYHVSSDYVTGVVIPLRLERVWKVLKILDETHLHGPETLVVIEHSGIETIVELDFVRKIA